MSSSGTINGSVNNLTTQYSYYISWSESDVNSTNNTSLGTNIGGTSYGDVLHFKTAKFHSSVGDAYPLPSFELS